MRPIVLAALVLLPLHLSVPALAQSAAAPDSAPAAQAPHRQTFREHFDSANTTHDGHLTLEQAKSAKWVAVVRRFDRMDSDHKGYVTAQEIVDEFRRERADRTKVNPSSNAAGTRG